MKAAIPPAFAQAPWRHKHSPGGQSARLRVSDRCGVASTAPYRRSPLQSGTRKRKLLEALRRPHRSRSYSQLMLRAAGHRWGSRPPRCASAKHATSATRRRERATRPLHEASSLRGACPCARSRRSAVRSTARTAELLLVDRTPKALARSDERDAEFRRQAHRDCCHPTAALRVMLHLRAVD